MIVDRPDWVRHDGGTSIFALDVHPKGTKLATSGSDTKRGAGGIDFAVCAQLASAVQSIYSAGVSYSTPFSCSTFTATSAVVCAVATSVEAGTTFYNNFNGNTAAFLQLSNTFNLQCINYGADQYDDSASISTCQAQAEMLVPCATFNIPFPFCACVDTPLYTPFTFSPVITESAYGLVAGKAANLYTFTIVIGAGYGKGSALNTASKAEFYLDQTMRSKVLGSTFNGAFQPPSWGSLTEQRDTFKVHFGSSPIPAGTTSGVEVGIIVDASVTLGALSSAFPTQLYYTIFSANLKYCPLGFSFPPN